MRTNDPKIVYAAPFVTLNADLRREAAVLRDGKADAQAAILDRTADRLDEALAQASECEYVDTAAAADFLRISEEGVRARCRRILREQGLARKRAGRWEVHSSVLVAA